MSERTFVLPDEAATRQLASRVAAAMEDGAVFHLEGELGAGKSSFARALLQALGVEGRIKSPTYSLVENYPLERGQAWHLDLYRIADPDELQWLGVDALGEPGALVLIEWPQRGQGAIPPPDVELSLAYAGTGRLARLSASSVRGERLLERLGAVGGMPESSGVQR
ncbi:MAG: tRNA (adenosine(37)-N6)-threonylcarbamoyltransferase complex ATPase subunit type 1 TsaE [Lysobacterales bacterium 13-68-4]|nr:MAG: tRNA (adenosine(37)-N6)-threonylcarbamoyltransferase complex ATPase subunit type 1 TsaE [Xanthomonadales bacterium 15-68-25]OZB66708.1 MAG: tRNA (adenosine(37)-N6)-threonylcarbamoyltransferase complex ATPase subunit type 1 TsaE [Xanthomonadales bacterium 14-68-21]OZB72432.1 MAG: tRNA (adenosine(37)-N6)-threonylcarbamoyltransferase complex ATPase subunit type 1 TsaE [Xanthomonadales bacterium 13-68-4]